MGKRYSINLSVWDCKILHTLCKLIIGENDKILREQGGYRERGQIGTNQHRDIATRILTQLDKFLEEK